MLLKFRMFRDVPVLTLITSLYIILLIAENKDKIHLLYIRNETTYSNARLQKIGANCTVVSLI